MEVYAIVGLLALWFINDQLADILQVLKKIRDDRHIKP